MGGGEFWSWDIQRLNLIKNKKTLADASVDGVIPSRVLPKPETMFKKAQESLKKWKERVDSGNIIETKRDLVSMNLYPEISNSIDRTTRIKSELNSYHRRANTSLSSTTHKEFLDNPESWFRYHALRNDRMKDWPEIPYEYIATKIKDKRDVVVDFGCGENLMRHKIPNNKVYAFDHVSIDDSVIACDMRNTGLNDETIDIAVFSLALWGTNYKEYFIEANRIMNRRGLIYIAEPSKNYESEKDLQNLINILDECGFEIKGTIENRGKFIYITGIKI
jgi:ribosomal RNA-processing protein 8